MCSRVNTPKTTTIIATAFVVSASICISGFSLQADFQRKITILSGCRLATISSPTLVEHTEGSHFNILKPGVALLEHNSDPFSSGKRKGMMLLQKHHEWNAKLSEKYEESFSKPDNDLKGEAFVRSLPPVASKPPSNTKSKRLQGVTSFEGNSQPIIKNPNSDTAEELRKWACATDVETLRLMFGTNRNKFWGDLNNKTARQLYHCLLPRALIYLYRKGLTPAVLAPLAYEARCAAKQYARERCNMFGRIISIAYDGIRHFIKYGFWSSKGLSWDELWSKYEEQVIQEIWDEWRDNRGPSPATYSSMEISSRICAKILEKSCATNISLDNFFFLKSKEGNPSSGKSDNAVIHTSKELLAMASKLEEEIHDLLRRSHKITSQSNFLSRFLITLKRKLLMLQQISKQLFMAKDKSGN